MSSDLSKSEEKEEKSETSSSNQQDLPKQSDVQQSSSKSSFALKRAKYESPQKDASSAPPKNTKSVKKTPSQLNPERLKIFEQKKNEILFKYKYKENAEEPFQASIKEKKFSIVMENICNQLKISKNDHLFICNKILVDHFSEKPVENCHFLFSGKPLEIIPKNDENSPKIIKSEKILEHLKEQQDPATNSILDFIEKKEESMKAEFPEDVKTEMEMNFDAFYVDSLPTTDDLVNLVKSYDEEKKKIVREDKIIDETSQEYYLFSVKDSKDSIKGANPMEFLRFFLEYFKLSPDKIISFDVKSGSLQYNLLFEKSIEFEYFMVNYKKDKALKKQFKTGLKELKKSIKEDIKSAKDDEEKKAKKRNAKKKEKDGTRELISEKHKKSYEIEATPFTVPDNFQTVIKHLKSHSSFPDLMKEPAPEKLAQLSVLDEHYQYAGETLQKMIHDDELKFHLKFDLKKIQIYHNEKAERKFLDHLQSEDKLIYLFHGCYSNEGVIHPLVYSGLSKRMMGLTDSGFFGKGFYFTPNLTYALFYQYNSSLRGWTLENLKEVLKDSDTCHFRMMVFLVNLGKCEEFNSKYKGISQLENKEDKDKLIQEIKKQNKGQPLPDDIDSRHIKVGRELIEGETEMRTSIFHPIETTPNSDLYFEEYVIRDKFRSLPQFVIFASLKQTSDEPLKENEKKKDELDSLESLKILSPIHLSSIFDETFFAQDFKELVICNPVRSIFSSLNEGFKYSTSYQPNAHCSESTFNWPSSDDL